MAVRGSLILATTALTSLALAGPVSAEAPPAASGPAAREGAERALEEARAVADGEGVRTGREYTLALREVAQGLPALEADDRREAEALLARPTDSGAGAFGDQGYTVPSRSNCTIGPGFCFHWVGSTNDRVPPADADGDLVPDYVETVAAEMSVVRDKENGDLGWRAPRSDGTRGGGVDKTDVYLKQLGDKNIFGYAATDPNQSGSSYSAYLVLDNDYAADEYRGFESFLEPLRVTAAHEYHHILQYAYDAFQDVWMFESSAVWMEDQVYDGIDDYVSYVRSWVTRTEVPLTRFDSRSASDADNIKVYGSAVWNHWLAERLGSTTIRGAWERSTSTTPASFAPAAYDRSIAGNGGTGFFDDFVGFSAAVAEWRAPGSGFSEGQSYPNVERRGTLTLGAAPATTTLDHTTFALMDVAPPTGSDLELTASVPSGTAGAIALVGRTGSEEGGAVTTRLLPLPAGGSGTVVLPGAGSMSRITAVLVNADVSQQGYSADAGDWRFTRDDQVVSASARAVPVGTQPPVASAVAPPPATASPPASSGGGGADSGGGGDSGSSGGGSDSGAPADPPPLPDRTVRVLPGASGVVVLGPRSQRRASVLRKGLAVTVGGGPASFSMSVSAGRPVVKRGSKVVGRARGSLSGVGTRTVNVRLSSAARRVLSRGGSLRLVARVGTASRAIVVRR